MRGHRYARSRGQGGVMSEAKPLNPNIGHPLFEPHQNDALAKVDQLLREHFQSFVLVVEDFKVNGNQTSNPCLVLHYPCRSVGIGLIEIAKPILFMMGNQNPPSPENPQEVQP